MPHVRLRLTNTRRARFAMVAIVALSALSLGAAPSRAASGPYVSLGDSYTSAPLVPNPTGNPIGCGRSTHNYPSDMARTIAPSSFVDASCASATTVDMTQSQSVPFGGTNAPQFSSLGVGDALVTVGIGGNDAGLISIAEGCASLDIIHPTGTAGKDHYNSGGSDSNVAAITPPGPRSRPCSRASTSALPAPGC